MADELHRLRVLYRKDGRLAYLGHLEVLNTLQRSIRRSGLPFLVGNGFARRMRVQFSQALPVGASSEGEYLDVLLTSRVDTREALERLRDAAPTALGPIHAAYVVRKVPALEAWLNRSLWRLDLLGEGVDPEALEEALTMVRDEGRITYLRGDKLRTIELEPTLVGWSLGERSEDGACLRMALETRSSNLGSLRPAVLIDAAFGMPPLADARKTYLRVCRTEQWHDENGERMEPFDETFCSSLT